MKIHQDCETLSIFSFYKIIETKDFTYLLKERKDEVELKENEELICKSAFSKILKEFEAETATNESIKDYKERIRIGYMEGIYNITTEILKIYETYEDPRVLELLKDCKWKFNKDKPANAQIKVVLMKMKGLKNRINIANLAYKQRFKKERPANAPKFNLEKEAIKLSISLKLGYLIQTKQTSVSTWINLSNINAEQLKLMTDG